MSTVNSRKDSIQSKQLTHQQTSTVAQAKLIDKSRINSWLNPLNMIEIQKAVLADSDRVRLRLKSGMVTFKITYPPHDKVYIEIEDGFVPCGTFDRRWILDYFIIYGGI